MANELILIIEDNEKNRKLCRDVLQVKGFGLSSWRRRRWTRSGARRGTGVDSHGHSAAGDEGSRR